MYNIMPSQSFKLTGKELKSTFGVDRFYVILDDKMRNLIFGNDDDFFIVSAGKNYLNEDLDEYCEDGNGYKISTIFDLPSWLSPKEHYQTKNIQTMKYIGVVEINDDTKCNLVQVYDNNGKIIKQFYKTDYINITVIINISDFIHCNIDAFASTPTDIRYLLNATLINKNLKHELLPKLSQNTCFFSKLCAIVLASP